MELRGYSIGVLGLMAAGCVTNPPRIADACVASSGQGFVGTRANADTGPAILEATHSRELRWFAPPQTIVTAEYKHGRVTVDLDRNGIILRVACG
jgi:Peptidase inhibitor I78 family